MLQLHVLFKNCTHNIHIFCLSFVRTSMGILEWIAVKVSLHDMQLCIKALARVQNSFLLLDLVLRVWAPLLFYLFLFLFCSMKVVIKSLHRQKPKFSEIFQKTKGRSHMERKLGGHKLPIHFCCKLFLHIFKVCSNRDTGPSTHQHSTPMVAKAIFILKLFFFFYKILIGFVYYVSYMWNFVFYLFT